MTTNKVTRETYKFLRAILKARGDRGRHDTPITLIVNNRPQTFHRETLRLIKRSQDFADYAAKCGWSNTTLRKNGLIKVGAVVSEPRKPQSKPKLSQEQRLTIALRQERALRQNAENEVKFQKNNLERLADRVYVRRRKVRMIFTAFAFLGFIVGLTVALTIGALI